MDTAAFERGIALFNARHFFESHEVLEDLWREAAGEERRFLQGLIQVAVGMHHFTRGNVRGARSLVARGAAKFEALPASYGGVALGTLRDTLESWRAHLAGEAPQPPFPRL
jgi:uncharacterized protein